VGRLQGKSSIYHLELTIFEIDVAFWGEAAAVSIDPSTPARGACARGNKGEETRAGPQDRLRGCPCYERPVARKGGRDARGERVAFLRSEWGNRAGGRISYFGIDAPPMRGV